MLLEGHKALNNREQDTGGHSVDQWARAALVWEGYLELTSEHI